MMAGRQEVPTPSAGAEDGADGGVKAPEHYPRRALVCLAGLSPQVITETLYALVHQQQPAFLPTELHVITTGRGLAGAQAALCGPQSPLAELLAQAPPALADGLKFDPQAHLHLISRHGRPLDDIDSIEDHTAVADTIVGVLRPLTADDQCAVHASLAGGRKTMGFYLGYALSLLGRQQDRLSHVLVNAPFESHRDFFFPPQVPRLLQTSGGAVISTAEARVTLAPVAVLYLGGGLSHRLAAEGASFEQLVRRAQADLVPEPAYLRLSVGEVSMGGHSLRLEPTAMAWYAYLAQRQRDGLQEEGVEIPGMIVLRKRGLSECAGIDLDVLWSMMQRCGVEIARDKLQSSLLHSVIESLKPKFSAINRSIDECFGKHTKSARRLRIVGPGERKAKDGHYGLIHLEPSLIHLC